jgi:mRNA-degrading endonuclease RelE of RelBE toxin-antitoxin system
MAKLYNSLVKLLQPKIRNGSIIRGIGVLAFSMGAATGVIYTNYLGYWKGTIYRTQTVDFNILANLLPAKISNQLLNKDTKGLQETLDSNYGLFGILITDCKSSNIDCPDQKIIYGSKIKVQKIDGNKRILISQDDYAKTWLTNFDNVSSPEEKLHSELFIPLYNPPSFEQAWEFATPRESQIIRKPQEIKGQVIGRIYLLRANPPLFIQELRQWLQNPLSTSSKTIVYNSIFVSAFFTGIFVWLLSEIIYFFKLENEKRIRIFTENETRILREIVDFEEDARIANTNLQIAIENELKAVGEKLQADKIAQSLQFQLTEVEERIKKEKLETEAKLHAIVEENERLFYEKLEVEIKLDANTEELEHIAKQINEAEDTARKAQEKSAQATEKKLRAEKHNQRALDQRQQSQENLTSTKKSKRLQTLDWHLEFSSEFKTQINGIDCRMQGRILKAISEISEAPMVLKSNTVKPLTRERRFAGYWRYRIGDYRLIYYPNTSTSSIKLLLFGLRKDLYL